VHSVRATQSLLLAWVLVAGIAAPGQAAEADWGGSEFFEKKIRPVFVEHCQQCHSDQARKAKKLKGALLLDTAAGIRKGGANGAILIPGKPADSPLIKALRHEELRMPPKVKLPDVVIADFEAWVRMGAPIPEVAGATASSAIDWNRARQFWAFQPPATHPLPIVQDSRWPRSEIDVFVLAEMEKRGLHPVRAAGKRVLLRRATFDLTGLPPTPEAVAAFLADDSPDAFARVVDRLLASPAYGERWGRHWLDVARYAEDQAHTFGVKPNTSAYRYRDWVIAALNDDMPYDRFVKLQIAGDLILDDDNDRARHLAALGFFGLGAQYYKDNTEILKALADELDERVDTLSRGLLGLTVACARCHDHKFDPVPTQDYYALAGIFNSSKLVDVPLATRDEIHRYQEDLRLAREVEEKLKQFIRVEKAACQEEQAGEIVKYLQAVRKVQEHRGQSGKWSARDQAKADGLDAATLDRWVKYLDGNPKVAALDAWRHLGKPAEPEAVDAAAKAFQDDVRKLLAERTRGNLDKDRTALLQTLFGDKGLFNLSDDELKARLLPDKKRQMDQMRQEAARLRKAAPDKMEAKFPVAHALAEGTAADMKVYLRGNPRTQGDVVPRHFLRVLTGDEPPRFAKGSGRRDLAEAIASSDNPLTARVIVNRVWAWHFGRGIVGTPSNFGNLGERPTHPELLDNLTCRFIASGWSLKALHRDIMLSAAYQSSSDDEDHNLAIDADNRFLWRMSRRRLDVESWRDALLFVSGKLDPTMGGQTTDLASGGNSRRTVYGRISRHALNGLLRLFDFPDANITSEKRTETTVPQQQLFVLNSPFIVEQARALAARAQAATKDDAERVRLVYEWAFARPASDADVQLAVRYLSAKDPTEETAKSRLTRWERFSQVLLASNEFMYVD
jgi:hypothetical protein